MSVTWEGGEPRWSGEDNVLRAGGISDYQGSGAILTKDHKVLSWWYGSCDHCDEFENLAYEPGDPWAYGERETRCRVVEKLKNEYLTQYASAEEALAAYKEARGGHW